MIQFGPIKYLILLGSSPLFANIIEYCAKLDIQIIVITCEDQKNCLTLIPKSTPTLITNKIDSEATKEFLSGFSLTPKNFIAISFGARWIFSHDVIVNLFLNKLINVHGSRLPLDRGGGGFSWRIMRGDRIGNLLIHMIDSGIDTGSIIKNEEYIIPKSCQIPIEIEADYQARLIDFLLDFITQITLSQCSFELSKQPNYLGNYNPRLWTQTHAWINWQWDPEEVLKFINAFDDPYSGAQSTYNKKVVTIKKVQLQPSDTRTHPFQSGLILRKSNNWCIIALKDGWSLIAESIRDENENNILTTLREGDRIHTPQFFFEAACAERAVIGTHGKITHHKEKPEIALPNSMDRCD